MSECYLPGHVPVGYQKVKAAALQHWQCSDAIISLSGVGKSQVTQEVLDDSPHCRKVIDDEDFHVLVQIDLRTVLSMCKICPCR